MTISTLIESRDTSEIVRDAIATILAAETVAQQALATTAAEDDPDIDPDEWKLRVFLERSNPWAEFESATDEAMETTPIVNVSLSSINYDGRASGVVQTQKASATFHVDCYGCAVSTETQSGHTAGDEDAALEAQRAVRLVRAILMAGAYTYLGLRTVVSRRWVESVETFQPQLGDRAVQQIAAARISLRVDFNESSPQVEGQAIEVISAAVQRAGSGEVIYLTAQYGEETP